MCLAAFGALVRGRVVCLLVCGGGPYLAAKALLHLAKRQRRVLDRIVKQRGRNALRVHAPRGHQLGDRDRVGDEGGAVAAVLAVVDAVGEL